MKLDFSGERVMAVVAHPDDAELLCAGTLARAREEGAAIAICVMCRGEKGQPAKPIRNLGAVRRREMRAAAAVLGAELFTGRWGDGELMDVDAPRVFLADVFRRFRPSLVLAHAPNDYHPDHRAVAALVDVATWFSASRGRVTRWPVLPAPAAIWHMDTIEMHGFEPGFYVDVSAWLPVKERMLSCHRSQLSCAGDSEFSPLLPLMRAQAGMRGAQAGVAAAEAFRIHASFKRCRAW